MRQNTRRGQAGDAEEALGHYQRSLEVREGLLRDNPQSGEAARDVSVSLDRLGDFLARRCQAGDVEKALGHHERSLEVREGLLRDNPQSGQAARDVSVSLDRLGEFLARRDQADDAEKALGHYERSLEVREGLLRDNPQSGQAARDVVVSCYKLGLFDYKLGNTDPAGTLLKRCFTLLDSFVREGRPMDPPMRATHEKLKPLFTESK